MKIPKAFISARPSTLFPAKAARKTASIMEKSPDTKAIGITAGRYRFASPVKGRETRMKRKVIGHIAAERIITGLMARGFQLVTVSQLIETQGDELEPGIVYRSK